MYKVKSLWTLWSSTTGDYNGNYNLTFIIFWKDFCIWGLKGRGGGGALVIDIRRVLSNFKAPLGCLASTGCPLVSRIAMTSSSPQKCLFNNSLIVSITKFSIWPVPPMHICCIIGMQSHGYPITDIQFEQLESGYPYLDIYTVRASITHT